MFELARSSLFFEQMNAAHPTIVQNVEIVFENKIALDSSFHQPKNFILGLNNLLRSLLFFIEHSKKNSPAWLKDAVESFLLANTDAYEKLRYLRNVSAHQALVIPDESLVLGLYRVRSANDYTLKLGFGDHGKPGKYAQDFAFKNTEDLFHDLLVFSSITFMDLEHSAIGECLGITRRWYFKIKFKNGDKRYNEVEDVYDLATSFSTSLLNHVCGAYATKLNVKFESTFARKLEPQNYINTLLEIDIFPSLFSIWWQEDCRPLNFGVRAALAQGRRYELSDQFHGFVYENLAPDAATYRSWLERFAALVPDDIFSEPNLDDFASFVLTNHWHFKKAFGGGINQSTVTASDVMWLQRIGNLLVDEFRKKKACTIASVKKQLDDHIAQMIEKIDSDVRHSPT